MYELKNIVLNKIIKKYDEIDSTYKMYEIDIHTIQNYEFEHCVYNSY